MPPVAFAQIVSPCSVGSRITSSTFCPCTPFIRSNSTRKQLLHRTQVISPRAQLSNQEEFSEPTDIPDDIALAEDDVPDTDFEERQRRYDSLSNASSDIPVPPNPTVVEVVVAPGRVMRLETGRMARQAAGAVAVRMGDTLVFCTACSEASCAPNVDFFPLRVDYSEKFSAMGKTSGSYVKREGRPSEREVLVSRLIDRPLRPMFENGYFNEVQVLANVFSYDGQNPADALAICGSAAALHISHIPLVEPVAGVRLAYVDNAFVVEPTMDEVKRATAELVLAGTRSGILMIEGYCNFLTEEVILDGVRLAHESIIRICDGIDQLRTQTGNVPKIAEHLRVVPPEIAAKMASMADGLDEALVVTGKKQRDSVVQSVRDRVFDSLKPSQEDELNKPNEAATKWTILRLAWKDLVSSRMRRRIIETGIRPDGRDVYTVRPITIDQAPLPCAHGSSLFTRGETQTLAVVTMGGDDMAQRSETLEGERASRFYLQYSFPPFSVGEVGRLGPPGRREIGHGKLAERALMAALPDEEDFPYVLRVESNILESNGSSSMASVCGGCLALLEAGVPLKSSVAGVAMGLVIDSNGDVDPETNEPKAEVLTDILGLEDALGCCDAKFAGNRHGWSALQLDVKLRGLSIGLFQRILQQAAKGRNHVLDCMEAVMPSHNPNLPASLPKVLVFHIAPRKIGEVIGAGGKTIRSIIDRCGGEDVTRISIDNDGRVSISSQDEELISRAQSIVLSYASDLEVGMTVSGIVTKVLPFGAYVEIADGKEGWLHISELEHKRTNSVEDVCVVGDKLKVRLTEIGRNGQFRLSRKACLASEPVAPNGTPAVDKKGTTQKQPGEESQRGLR